jgi:hypothetical protein
VLVPAAMADKLIAVLSCLPNTTYDLPADDLSNAGKSYVIFGKQDNTDAINLSAIATVISAYN